MLEMYGQEKGEENFMFFLSQLNKVLPVELHEDVIGRSMETQGFPSIIAAASIVTNFAFSSTSLAATGAENLLSSPSTSPPPPSTSVINKKRSVLSGQTPSTQEHDAEPLAKKSRPSVNNSNSNSNSSTSPPPQCHHHHPEEEPHSPPSLPPTSLSVDERETLQKGASHNKPSSSRASKSKTPGYSAEDMKKRAELQERTRKVNAFRKQQEEEQRARRLETEEFYSSSHDDDEEAIMSYTHDDFKEWMKRTLRTEIKGALRTLGELGCDHLANTHDTVHTKYLQKFIEMAIQGFCDYFLLGCDHTATEVIAKDMAEGADHESDKVAAGARDLLLKTFLEPPIMHSDLSEQADVSIDDTESWRVTCDLAMMVFVDSDRCPIPKETKLLCNPSLNEHIKAICLKNQTFESTSRGCVPTTKTALDLKGDSRTVVMLSLLRWGLIQFTYDHLKKRCPSRNDEDRFTEISGMGVSSQRNQAINRHSLRLRASTPSKAGISKDVTDRLLRNQFIWNEVGIPQTRLTKDYRVTKPNLLFPVACLLNEIGLESCLKKSLPSN